MKIIGEPKRYSFRISTRAIIILALAGATLIVLGAYGLYVGGIVEEQRPFLPIATLCAGVLLAVYAFHRFMRKIGWEGNSYISSGYESSRGMILAALIGAVVFGLAYIFETFDLYFLLPEWFVTFWDTSV